MFTPQEQEIFDELAPVVQGLGANVVDISWKVSHGIGQLHLIVFRKEGIGHKDLAEIHRVVAARIEVMTNCESISMELSTPGIERVIKNQWEYDLYLGKGIKIMLLDGNDWEYGVIQRVTDDSVIMLQSDENIKEFPRERIRKAKLDPQQDRG